MTEPQRWHTAIGWVEPDSIRVRGYAIEELMGRLSFGEAAFLVLRGRLPDPAEARLFEAALVASVDHGATTPCALVARMVASTGAPLSTAVAAGVSSVSRFHGGAIQACLEVLKRVVERETGDGAAAAGQGDAAARGPGGNLQQRASLVVAEFVAAGRRVPGFGHRVHRRDPRAVRLFELARGLGQAGPHLEAASCLERALTESRGRPLHLNVDGALAAVLGDMGFEPEQVNGVFIISRAVGLVAHAAEELQRGTPMRSLEPAACGYDGPPERSLG